MIAEHRMITERASNAVKVLEVFLTPAEQLEVAEAVLENHGSLRLTLTKADALRRMQDAYGLPDGDAEKLAHEFFESDRWAQDRSRLTDWFWGIEDGERQLNDALHEWLMQRNINRKDN